MRKISRRSVLGMTAAVVTGALSGRPRAALADPTPPSTEFCWGVGTCGFQSEGHSPDSHQRRSFLTRSQLAEFPDSVDFYTRYREDIGLAADLGVGVYRITIEWARLQPEPGAWDEDGFAFYDRVLDAMAAQGIRPMLVLDSWVYPVWVGERGGWRSPQVVDAWVANARKVVDRYADRDPLWITFITPAGYVKYEVQDGMPLSDVPAMAARIVQAHNAIYDHIHRVRPDARVGMSMNVGIFDVTESVILDQVVDRVDYVGLGNYISVSLENLPDLAEHAVIAPHDLSSPLAYWVQPESIFYALRYCARRYPGKPLYVVDNGIVSWNGYREDGYDRADHLRDTVYWIQRARSDGIDVIGYNYWGLTDTFEWGSYDLRYGLYSVEVRTDPTLTRRPTDAVAAYREITTADGVPHDYLPTRDPAACSLVDLPSSCGDPVTVPR
ncbi:family 1 glycosylhydrolase [Nocardia sp. NPDC059240]|uniref:family 1 glycosylhydrolase n=1 Tax=Nocardia sp. NPDC059240 TaxID=3346786 RepID=UPI0036CD4EB6